MKADKPFMDDTPQRGAPKAEKSIAPPSDFDSEADFLAYARRLFQDDMDYDRLNRDAGFEDAQFVAGDQWDATTRANRERRRRPVLTVNRLPAFVAVITGNRRLNETSIKVLPESAADKKAAEIRQGLIRNIEKVGRADLAYDKALENAVICGIGNFGVSLDYNYDDVFVQDINFDTYPNPFAVVWDRSRQDPTGRDANHVFVTEVLTKAQFDKKYPGKMPSDLSGELDLLDARASGWIMGDNVRIANFWRMRSRKRALALLQNGKTVDITDREDDAALMAQVFVDPATGAPKIREVERPYAEMYCISGTSILSGPYELPISRVPVFRVPGWEINIGDVQQRFGLVRFMKDPQRLHNYWRSIVAEKLMMTPRARWVATKEAVAGREREWREAHLSDDPLLTWNGEAGTPPQYTPPAQMEAALIQEANLTVQDLRDVSNLHEASLGQQSNEVSGRAILARQRVGETGTVVYHDNLRMAQEEAGSVINALIPVAYDTARTVKIIKPGTQEEFVRINDETDPDSVDITQGRYSIALTTGPSYITRRVEAQESMQALFNANPQAFAPAIDILVDAFDFPEAERIAARLRQTLPPGIRADEELSDEERAAQQQQVQMQQQIEQVQMQVQMAAAQAEVAFKQGQATKAEADAKAAEAQAALTQAQVEKTQAETLKMMAEISSLVPAPMDEVGEMLSDMEADDLIAAQAREDAAIASQSPEEGVPA